MDNKDLILAIVNTVGWEYFKERLNSKLDELLASDLPDGDVAAIAVEAKARQKAVKIIKKELGYFEQLAKSKKEVHNKLR